MKIEDKIRGKNKLRYDINRKAANQHYHQVKLIQMNSYKGGDIAF